MARQAMSEQERQLRRDEVLAAAHRLFRARRELPPVADIAREAGLAKGTVYLYFATKEEIFIGLLEREFHALLTGLPALLQSLPDDPAAAAAQFAAPYAQAVRALPDLLPLAAISNGVLEQNLPFAAVTRFKLYLARELESCGQLLESRFPQLAPGGGTALLLHSYALTLGLWQALSYPRAFVDQLSREEFRVLQRDFASELQPAVTRLWEGSLRR